MQQNALNEWKLLSVLSGFARDLWYGKEYWVAEEMHTGQRGSHAGSTDSSCNTHTQTKCGGLQGSCAAQVQTLVFNDMMITLNLCALENLEQDNTVIFGFGCIVGWLRKFHRLMIQ